jgi:hypothetical protein
MNALIRASAALLNRRNAGMETWSVSSKSADINQAFAITVPVVDDDGGYFLACISDEEEQ